MKKSLCTILLAVLMSMVGTKALAYDIKLENDEGVVIYYNYINDGKELEVTTNDSYYGYSDSVVIPEEVTYINRTRKVTKIGEDAFANSYLTSVTIPSCITFIGKDAFMNCNFLTAVNVSDIDAWFRIQFFGLFSNPLFYANHLYLNGKEVKDLVIPNSVTSIGDFAFSGCGLTSVIFSNNVTSIGELAFRWCGLTSITFPDNVEKIGESAFDDDVTIKIVDITDSYSLINKIQKCGRLNNPKILLDIDGNEIKEVAIPNGVTSIYYFRMCRGLTSVTFPNSVTSIEDNAFSGCSSLTSVTFPNSVTYIGEYAFSGCSGLTSVTFPNSVIFIQHNAFSGCKNLTSIMSLIENPWTIYGKATDYRTFDLDVFNNATLYVPIGAIDNYKETEGWKDFFFIEEGSGPNSGGETPETKKCATPTIGYQNGKLTFYCETDGAICQYTITNDDVKSGSSEEIQLGVTYNINVYATKPGYEDSDVAKATLCWIDENPKIEGVTNGVANVRARTVLIQNNDSDKVSKIYKQ